MARPLLLPALAALTLVGTLGIAPAIASTDPGAAVTEEDTQSMPDKIRDKLQAQGYKDITVMPTSYAVSATDENGKPVLLLIGPRSSTPIEKLPEQAESPPGKEQLIQQ